VSTKIFPFDRKAAESRLRAETKRQERERLQEEENTIWRELVGEDLQRRRAASAERLKPRNDPKPRREARRIDAFELTVEEFKRAAVESVAIAMQIIKEDDPARKVVENWGLREKVDGAVFLAVMRMGGVHLSDKGEFWHQRVTPDRVEDLNAFKNEIRIEMRRQARQLLREASERVRGAVLVTLRNCLSIDRCERTHNSVEDLVGAALATDGPRSRTRAHTSLRNSWKSGGRSRKDKRLW
jgi:hypothetical protein